MTLRFIFYILFLDYFLPTVLFWRSINKFGFGRLMIDNADTTMDLQQRTAVWHYHQRVKLFQSFIVDDWTKSKCQKKIWRTIVSFKLSSLVAKSGCHLETAVKNQVRTMVWRILRRKTCGQIIHPRFYPDFKWFPLFLS